MTDMQPHSPWTLLVLAWCWLVAIGATMVCLWLLMVSVSSFGSSSPTTAALVGAGLMVALLVGIPAVTLWVGLIQQVRGRDRWRGLVVTALVLLAAETLALPVMNAAAGSANKAFVGLLSAVGIAVLAPAVIILVQASGSAGPRR